MIFSFANYSIMKKLNLRGEGYTRIYISFFSTNPRWNSTLSPDRNRTAFYRQSKTFINELFLSKT
jgi:hypothetical protein